MGGRRLTLIAVLLSSLKLSWLLAAQASPPGPAAGRTVHVVAVKTSSRVELAVWDRLRDVTQSNCGKPVHFQIPGEPGAGRPFTATLERSCIGETPFISTDPVLKTEIEKALAKQKKFKVVENLSQAELVLVAFAEYPLARLVLQGRQILSAWRGYEDSPYSHETITVLAFALSANSYRLSGTGVQELSDAALWQGYTQIVNFGCNRSAQSDAANELVKRFHEDLRHESRRRTRPDSSADSEPGRAGQSALRLKTTRDTPEPPGRTFTSAPEAAVRVARTAVIVPVAVSYRDGRHIPELAQTDFRLFEDGIEQKIHHFRAVETPFRVVLLLDSSASMRLKSEELSRAAIAFLDRLPPQDPVMVASFDGQVRLQAEFTENRASLHEAISRTGSGRGTRLYDAVDLILTERLSLLEGRKAIVLFTDGVDTESRLTDRKRTLELAEESGALIYSILYDTAGDVVERPLTTQSHGRGTAIRTDQPNVAEVGEEAYRSGREYVSGLTQATGALEYRAASAEDLSRAFSQIATELGRQYELAYYPTNPGQAGSYRRITVQVNRPDAVIRACPGYRARPDKTN